jgi:epoxyqueuosine reductase
VLRGRLQQLGEFLSALSPGAIWSPVVDTGAILEKPWAAAAGLGWQGKHTNLIDAESGSWFFLGELVTDLQLQPDPSSVTDRCGSCTRCLEACPTQAFPEPYVLDARRCISYLTIEHRGPIPEEHRAGMGNWVFGCDVCQEVCPWNENPVQGDVEFETGGDAPALAELMRLSREEFQHRYAGTPLRRTGWRRLLRNVAVALGNSGDPGAVQPLRDALAIPDPLIQEHVRWALHRLGADVPSAGGATDGTEG